MSVLRISRPGLPTRLVALDDGATPTGKPRYTGALVTAALPVSRPPRTDEQRLRENESQRARRSETCNLRMRNTGALCARARGHADACRTATWMQGQAMSRRTV